ncbi:MAG: hypothetical protein WBP59_17345 [Ilumatobacteraceae bacterium]
MSEEEARTQRFDELAQRAVASFMTLVRRGTQLAVGTLAVVTVICLGTFALGIAALTDGMEVVWILLGGFAAFIAIGSIALAMFRLWIVKRMSVELVSEVNTLIASDPRSERVVIETVESTDGVQDQSAVVMSRQFFAMNDTVGGRTAQFVALSAALRSITTFPLLMLLSTAITFGMACLGFLFLLGILI